MTDKITPIPKRASARKKPEPQPLVFPQPNRNIHVSEMLPVPLTEEDVKILVQQYVRKALDDYSANLYHTLYRSEADIVMMGEAQFQALMRDVRDAE